MQTHRFYLPPDSCAGKVLQLGGREAHHALHVLRLKGGDALVVLDGVGHEFICEITDCARKNVSLRVIQKHIIPPPPVRITLLQALPKGKIIESIIQKSAELGAFRVVPLMTERVVARLDEDDKASKREQWQAVAVEAIKQCGAAWLPKIETPVTIEQFLARREPFDLSLVGSLQSERRHPRQCFRDFESKHGRGPESVAFWIGPEGDFAPDELKTIEAAGAFPISLGPLTLRVETAAIYCLTIVNYESGGS